MSSNTLKNFPTHAFQFLSSFCLVSFTGCMQKSSGSGTVNMKIYMVLMALGWTDCCNAGGGVNFDVMQTLTFTSNSYIYWHDLLFKQAGFHIASGNKDLSDMLNTNKQSDNSAVYHSWINSILEGILHELDEKFEIAEEDRESTNFWIVTMAVLGLVLLISMAVTFTVLITRLFKKQSGPGDFELGEFCRDRRGSRPAEDINVNFKREP